MNNSNHVIFDKPYSSDKTAEGLAIQWAVTSGACNTCKHLRECESKSNFVFPKRAACMKKKAELIKKYG